MPFILAAGTNDTELPGRSGDERNVAIQIRRIATKNIKSLSPVETRWIETADNDNQHSTRGPEGCPLWKSEEGKPTVLNDNISAKLRVSDIGVGGNVPATRPPILSHQHHSLLHHHGRPWQTSVVSRLILTRLILQWLPVTIMLDTPLDGQKLPRTYQHRHTCASNTVISQP